MFSAILVAWLFMYIFLLAYMSWFFVWAVQIKERCGDSGGSAGAGGAGGCAAAKIVSFDISLLQVLPLLVATTLLIKLAFSSSLLVDAALIIFVAAFLIAARVFVARIEHDPGCRACIDSYTLGIANILLYIYGLLFAIALLFPLGWNLYGRGGV
jgi:hypothetical protein